MSSKMTRSTGQPANPWPPSRARRLARTLGTRPLGLPLQLPLLPAERPQASILAYELDSAPVRYGPCLSLLFDACGARVPGRKSNVSGIGRCGIDPAVAGRGCNRVVGWRTCPKRTPPSAGPTSGGDGQAERGPSRTRPRGAAATTISASARSISTHAGRSGRASCRRAARHPVSCDRATTGTCSTVTISLSARENSLTSCWPDSTRLPLMSSLQVVDDDHPWTLALLDATAPRTNPGQRSCPRLSLCRKSKQASLGDTLVVYALDGLPYCIVTRP